MTCSGTSCGCGMSSPKTFNNIDGTPIKYTAECVNFSQVNVRAETSFYNMLVPWIRQLRSDSKGYGGTAFNTLSWLGHVGAYTQKAGCHGKGRAFDLNKIIWSGYTVSPCNYAHESTSLSLRRRYLALDAGCRYHFRYVFDGWYDSAHRNHFHMENHSAPFISKSSKSDVKFVQAVCNNFNSAGLVVDGIWGTNTNNAWNAINSKWHYSTSKCNPFTTTYHYRAWLYLVIAHGYSNQAAGAWWAGGGCNT